MMTSFIVLVIAGIISLRTATYGIWTLKSRNISGGIAVLVISAGELATAIYFVAKG
ncbi:MAG: hypothetical protein PUB42_01595 [Firmicutes bacterium]|nr:hypothetical protein [Bacillota bacterium]